MGTMWFDKQAGGLPVNEEEGYAVLHGAPTTSSSKISTTRRRATSRSNSETNLVTACRTCNCSRQDKPLARFCGSETRAHVRRNTRRSLRKYRVLAKAILADETGMP